jgi:TonB family protein
LKLFFLVTSGSTTNNLRIMKTKKINITSFLKLLSVFSLIILLAIILFSCSARNKISKTQTEIAPPPPPPPPPPQLNEKNQTNQIPQFQVTGNDTVYSRVDEMPKFPGGFEAFEKLKLSNMNYPQELKNIGIEGNVIASFTIAQDGSISGIKILKGVSPSLDAEAIRVLKLMPSWYPAKVAGKPVKFMYWTSIEFSITPQKITEETSDSNNEEPFVIAEEMPMFPGGDSALLSYIVKNTKYPESAKYKGIQGKVIIRFCVAKDGSVKKISVLRKVSPDLDAEALRVVSTLPAFKPGKQGGRPVPVWYMVPISFALNDGNLPKSGNSLSEYDEAPVFPGGEMALNKFIYSNLVYPEGPKKMKISGKVMINFCINPDGTVSDVSVLKGVDPELDGEAVRVIRQLPVWKPGKLKGIPVKVCYNLPVNFTI